MQMKAPHTSCHFTAASPKIDMNEELKESLVNNRLEKEIAEVVILMALLNAI